MISGIPRITFETMASVPKSHRHWNGSHNREAGGGGSGMTLRVASVIGVEGGHKGVKREAQVPIAEGVELLSSYPMEEDWL